MLSIAELKALSARECVPFTCVGILRKLIVRKAKNGAEFLVADVGDRSGVFSLLSFADSPLYPTFKALKDGDVVRLQGMTGWYQDRFSPKINTLEVLTEEELAEWTEYLVERSPEDPAVMWAELGQIVELISRPELRQTIHNALQDHGEAFQSSPAAISMHHAYRHGLLEHSIHLCRIVRQLLPLYPEVDGDLALAGAILHDIGKVLEYGGVMSPRRTRAGLLQGHVILGYRIVRRAAMAAKLPADILERLEHVILSHQGEMEWGAAAMAATPEAVFVSMIDNLDAKMGMVQYALRTSPAEAEFSDHMPGLKASVLLTKTATAAAASGANGTGPESTAGK